MEDFETVFLACAWVLVIVMMISFIAVFIILIRVACQLIFVTKKPAPKVKEKQTGVYRDTSTYIIRG